MYFRKHAHKYGPLDLQSQTHMSLADREQYSGLRLAKRVLCADAPIVERLRRRLEPRVALLLVCLQTVWAGFSEAFTLPSGYSELWVWWQPTEQQHSKDTVAARTMDSESNASDPPEEDASESSSEVLAAEESKKAERPEFYDPELDEEDERWVDKRRQGRQSDAILSCPGCLSTVCLDCQAHAQYEHQYRAVEVINCRSGICTPSLRVPRITLRPCFIVHAEGRQSRQHAVRAAYPIVYSPMFHVFTNVCESLCESLLAVNPAHLITFATLSRGFSLQGGGLIS